MNKPIKFSTLKARILVMIGPSISVLSMSFSVFFLGFMLNLWEEPTILLLLCGMVFLIIFHSYLIVTYNLQLNRNIKELREAYPALEQDWYDLNYADYLDEDLQLLIYGDHLICYRTFDIVYLPECQRIYASYGGRVNTGGGSISQKTINFTAIMYNGKEHELRTDVLKGFGGIDLRAHKFALLGYIEEHYDHIEVIKRR